MSTIDVQIIDPRGFNPDQASAWLTANAIGHHVPAEVPVYIVNGVWIRALTLPLRRWSTDPCIRDQLGSGKWGADLKRTRVRWYLLRSRPEQFGYVDTTREGQA